MKVTLILFGLWIVGLLIAHALFLGLSENTGYSFIFSWWFVTYFSKLFKTIDLIDITLAFLISLTLLGFTYFFGLYGYLYHGVPGQFSLGFALIIVLHGILVVSPLMFNKAMQLLISRFKL